MVPSCHFFLVADTHSFVRLLVHDDLVKKWKKSVLDTFFVRLWGGGLGVDGGWMPLPTRPQRYCDPASLVSIVFQYLFIHFIILDQEKPTHFREEIEKIPPLRPPRIIDTTPEKSQGFYIK